jgi:dipeptidyl aminopeptidase/acylaminoacyl peptidase
MPFARFRAPRRSASFAAALSTARATTTRLSGAFVLILAVTASALAQATRPMTFVDVQEMRSFGATDVSPDGRWLVYTITTPDWQQATRQSDIYIVSLAEGVASTRQLTFTDDADETQPTWAPDGSFFVFLSNRDAPANASSRRQLYMMRLDVGEARRITDASRGVSDFEFSADGRWLVYRSGASNRQQLYRVPVARFASGERVEPEQITRQQAGVQRWQIAPDSRRVYLIRADSIDGDEERRREQRFTVDIYHEETPLSSLWSVDLATLAETRLTNDASYSVTGFTISDDSRWVGFRGTDADRFKRLIHQSNLHTELYLLDAASGAIERLTHADEISKAGPYFSPDGRWIAFRAPRDLTRYHRGMTDRIYVRAVGDRGGEFRRLGDDYDGDVGFDFWSPDGNTIYWNAGVRSSRQLKALDVRTGAIRALTDQPSPLSVDRDARSGVLLVRWSDAATPANLYVAPSLARVNDRRAWRQVTDVNPHVASFVLGEQRVITWRSTDGVEVEGILVLPVGYEQGQRYPTVVQIHGGPSSAVLHDFSAAMQVWAGNGYAVIRPNYRGSSNYGYAFEQINGVYFPQGYEDIMAGVDHLIAEGITDGERMGAFGWSAGGHWSNWILVNTDRFKAISSGAGAVNWISMYAQTDGQRHRQEYFGGQLPYHDFDAYWDQSPLKYITNARTPTMIHVVKGDPRVPSPQSVELHMALRQLGVTTELFMYPGDTHGIPDPRNQLVKNVSEMAWMDYYVRGRGNRFAWRDVLQTLEPTATAAANDGGANDR